MFQNVTGLTGGMGCGKSTVSAMLKTLGYTIVDADKLTHLVHQNPRVCQKLAETFGPDVITQIQGVTTICRPQLAEHAFASDSARQKLNDIMQPELFHAASEAIQNAPGPVILDAPLLFEAGWNKLVAQTAVILCPLQTRIQRIIARDHLTPAQITARLNAQISDLMRCQKAQILIYNCADIETLRLQVMRVFV